MRASFSGDGLDITLGKSDAELVLSEGSLFCRLQGWKNSVIGFHIRRFVRSRGMENPGFHIDVFPFGVSPEHRERYDVYLSRAEFGVLTHPEEDPIVIGGHFTSRSLYDSVKIHYFGSMCLALES